MTAEPLPFDKPSSLLDGLNPVQREAVTHPGGPILVVAGAGSGKTRVLTHRVAQLIRDLKISPFAILAITFTNKAADEMKERVGVLVGPVAQKMWVSTFHSACARILRREAAHLGMRSTFSIYDQSDAVRLTGYILRDLNIDPKRLPPRQVHAAISAAKNELIGPAELLERALTPYDKKLAEVYTEYQKRLTDASALDFDDLLTSAVYLFRSHPDVASQWRSRFAHVLVDEFQDTNVAQWELVRTLSAEHRNIMVVGGADEALYLSREIHRLVEEAAYRFGDLAVFYRTNAQSRALEEMFVRSGIPYRVVGGVKFYDRKEVKDVLAYLRALANPDDEVSLKRIVNVPKRGVGDTSVNKVEAYAAERNLTFGG